MKTRLWIDTARNVARRLAKRHGTVTIDMVRNECPPPDDVDPRIMGTVFRHPDFTNVGYACSVRKECHGRPIGIFKLVAA